MNTGLLPPIPYLSLAGLNGGDIFTDLTLCLGCCHLEGIRAAVEMSTLPEVCNSGLVNFGFFLSSLMDSDLKSFLTLLKHFIISKCHSSVNILVLL